ncbi:MAG TPA: acyl-CoA dehydrogenase family protein [Gemmatimonadota bacterium]|nr:acyl-CoA dehydrogenase family protein [Gemmatimonadota bacterium]
MNFDLSPEQKLLRDEISRFARSELNEGVRERDRDQEFPRELWNKCGEMKLQGLPVDEEHGGGGLDALDTAIALEAFGYGCDDGGLVFAVCAHLLACVVPIWKHGTPGQKERWLPGLCEGSTIAVNGMTEPDSGSDAFAMSTRAERDGDGWVLNGAKTFSSNGPVADLALVYAVTDPGKGFGGITAFVVEKQAGGFRAGQKFEKMGLRSCPIGELVLEDVRVGEDAVLGGVDAGATVFSQSMDWERALLGATHVGTMERLLEGSIQHARTRKSGSQPIGKNQAISHKIADMKVRLEASRLLVYQAAWRLERTRASAIDASIAKLVVSDSLVESAHEAVQILGGYGFLVEQGVERTLRDSVASTIYSGTNEMQRNIIARWLGL